MNTKKISTSKEPLKSEDQVGKLDFSKNENSFRIEPIENTPFHTVYEKGKGHSLFMGNYRLSEPYTTHKEAEKVAKKMTWDRVIQVIVCLIDQNNKQAFNLNKLQNEN